MDREIPQEIRRREQGKLILKFVGGIIIIILFVWIVISFLQPSIYRRDIETCIVDKGTIEISVSASGKVIPAFEEIINSPINTRIIEIYKKGGDEVDIGTPLLRLDLQSTETEYNKLLDEEKMKELQLEQLKLTTANKLSEMEMKLKVSRMELNRKEVEFRNELYLDSLGAGTTEKVRQVELSYNVALLQLKEDEQKFENEKELAKADMRVKELEFNIFKKGLAETKRTLEDARIRSPRKAILTYINNEIGAQVSQGTKIAVISDLSNFKIEGEIADAYGDKIATGNKAIVKIGEDKLSGMVSEVTPLSRNGVISFSVQLDKANHPRLRSGLKTDVYIMNAIREDVLRITNASYYSGKKTYDLFVVNGDQLFKRKVELGDSNFEYVEVISGLEEGDEIVISTMSEYNDKEKIKLNP
ncbi:MAG: HlyD family efflux transporter periplasmic adaptor subunit [Bacteroidales bacterium]|nr:HlyD family efflux transporter periplasmic adaptor subunit [Bacteroidales bacterium]